MKLYFIAYTLYPYLIPLIAINSRWIKDIKAIPKTMKLMGIKKTAKEYSSLIWDFGDIIPKGLIRRTTTKQVVL